MANYRECNRCLLNTNVVEKIKFDDAGICNYCNYYDETNRKMGSMEERSQWLNAKVNEIKRAGRGKEYDCIVGVSGGVDSTFLAYWAKETGLRPLVVHLDNGWNSELATQNITNICARLGLSLDTHVINWEEFREMQLAYLRAGVVDIEALSDHAIMATINKLAVKYKIKYTLSGFNYATEAIMPKEWVFDKGDWKNIKDICEKYGSGKKISTFPHITFLRKLYNFWFLKLESVQVLNYLFYQKEDAKRIITEKLNWRDYGGKHFESVFTKFYQAYILPEKFHIDKRYAHLSNLICSGQVSKDEALREIKKPIYSPLDLEAEKKYVLKKLQLKEEDFDKFMKEPCRKHDEFKTEKILWRRYFRLIDLFSFKKKYQSVFRYSGASSKSVP